MRNIKTREGFEFWDKVNALPHYAFLLSPSGKSVQKFEDKAMGNWIDVHEAQKIVDQAQDRISELRDELGAAKGEYDRAVNKLDDLQLRLSAADQRIDDFAGGECEWHREADSGIWNSGCGETWSFHEDGPEENGMNFCHSCGKSLVVACDEEEPDSDDDWRMNPCKQGHRDVGAAGSVAHCYQCDEKIEAATTQEAFERWNATHPKQ
ncbi:hypothetical protein SAMN05216205_4880 [Pseudomonas mohnii]|uniref:Double zinc ribbon n=1 Tax=Pseudomonas mohnii TaxID=395600 RepID=A0ABY0YC35_9PSED|nr:hypothetical protein [Pseudomonas mohnii]SED31285.1 hypothetical protein SAMN05216205_4880 [Pseudomonas mohnii]